MKRALGPILLAALAAASAQTPAPTRPKLILVLMVDQFRIDYFTRFGPVYNGGLARLWNEGAVFTNAHQDHFPTVTAIGHATILTGAPPSVSGIIGNEWYDRESGKQVTSVSDDSMKLLGGGSRAAASPRRLLVSSLGDQLKMSGRGRHKVIGISFKDRSAILPGGRMADAAYWFDNRSGNFVSSTYYFPEVPEWVAQFNRGRTADRFLGAEWTPIEAGASNHVAQPFRKMLAAAGPDYYAALQSTPYGNELLELFIEQAIEHEQLGRGEPDVLAISFSSNDYIGHEHGPDSPQVRDISIRTDRLLARLFRLLDQRVGMKNVLVVMSADHGVAPMPELMQQRRMPGGRIPEQAVEEKVQQRLTALYGEGKWVVGTTGPAPYLNLELIRQKSLDAAEVRRRAAEAAREIPHMLRVYTLDQVQAGHLLDDMIDRRIRNGFHAGRASDLFVVAEPYWLFEDRGTSHGSPFHYDSHVPLVFLGGGVRAGRYHRRTSIIDVAPTLAAMFDVESPSGSSGRVLEEMLGGR